MMSPSAMPSQSAMSGDKMDGDHGKMGGDKMQGDHDEKKHDDHKMDGDKGGKMESKDAMMSPSASAMSK